ncbi:MAG: 16S rRNA (guanine(966)-N(2))-methyltransferase RsmD [Myxococcota bacterium]
MRIIGGRLSGRRFGAPSGKGTRPTSDRVREGLGSALASRGAFEGACVLDLFAGSGALSFEALSRGAASATLVDSDARVLREIKASATTLDLGNSVQTVRADLATPSAAVRRIRTEERTFDLLFIDAPYSDIGLVPPVLEAIEGADLMNPGAYVVVEHPRRYRWEWTKGLASEADYRYGHTVISLGVYQPKGTK